PWARRLWTGRSRHYHRQWRHRRAQVTPNRVTRPATDGGRSTVRRVWWAAATGGRKPVEQTTGAVHGVATGPRRRRAAAAYGRTRTLASSRAAVNAGTAA